MAYSMDLTLLSNSGSASQKQKVAIVVGAGGTGGRLIPPLLKIFQPQDVIYIIDHDVVEARNLHRQNFGPEDIGHFKSQVMENRYNNSGGPQIMALITKLDKEKNFTFVIDNHVADYFIFGCVDNDDARKVMLGAAKILAGYQPTVYIDLGNETRDGQAVVAYASAWMVASGGAVYKQPDMTPTRVGSAMYLLAQGHNRFPELFNTKTAEPGVRCGENLDLQTVAVNQMAATAGLNLALPFVYPGMKLRNLGVEFSTYGTMTPILPNKVTISELNQRIALSW